MIPQKENYGHLMFLAGLMIGAAFMLIGSILAWPAHSAEYQARYLSNYDADTLRLEINGRNEAVRLSDVDAPEIKGGCPAEKNLAIRAREFTRTWAMRSDLTLTTGKREREKYGRLLGTLTNTEGESLGDKLIDAGLAVRWAGRRNQHWCDQ